MSLALTRKLAVVLGLVLLAPTALRAEFQTLWLIGGEDNPAQFSFNLRHGFSPANDINDPPPGKVTRLPGDPLFDPVNNPLADDDFYLAGLYPAGFNGLVGDLSVPNSEPNN